MEPYANRGGNSGVRAYLVSPGTIDVQFTTGAVYRYTDASAGTANLATMCQLARAGAGLNAFITRHVRFRYSERLL